MPEKFKLISMLLTEIKVLFEEFFNFTVIQVNLNLSSYYINYILQ